MRTTLKPAQILSISLLLFAVFFGAGNMIFRHSLDFLLENMWISITGFIITDVGLSLLAIVAVALAGGSFNTLASRVHQNSQQYSLSLFIFQSAHYLLFHELDLYLTKLGLHHFSQTNGTLC